MVLDFQSDIPMSGGLEFFVERLATQPPNRLGTSYG